MAKTQSDAEELEKNVLKLMKEDQVRPFVCSGSMMIIIIAILPRTLNQLGMSLQVEANEYFLEEQVALKLQTASLRPQLHSHLPSRVISQDVGRFSKIPTTAYSKTSSLPAECVCCVCWVSMHCRIHWWSMSTHFDIFDVRTLEFQLDRALQREDAVK